jgi:hypothetical protein
MFMFVSWDPIKGRHFPNLSAFIIFFGLGFHQNNTTQYNSQHHNITTMHRSKQPNRSKDHYEPATEIYLLVLVIVLPVVEAAAAAASSTAALKLVLPRLSEWMAYHTTGKPSTPPRTPTSELCTRWT